MLGIAASLILFPAITTPKQEFGYNIGDDYFLANYKQLESYWKKLDRESDRMQVASIGKTEEGRDQLVAIVSDPSNMKQLAHYKSIARQLCLAKDLSPDQAKALAKEGKSVVWIDGGLHASEVLGAQQLIETCYRMVSGTDEETNRILKDCIILFVHANPDGMDLCSDWYMRNSDPKKRSLSNLPRLYQKYIGHDNNRDFYLSSQAETTNMNRLMYKEWFPQIVYNHHQTGPAGTVMFAPPFRDPFNYYFDPLIVSQIDFLGSAMMSRFIQEDKPGVTVRSGAPYSTWWNGGLRTMAYFHNMVGLLTETIGSPTPSRIPFVLEKSQPRADMIMPIHPQEWHFKQSIEYEVTANMAVLNAASCYREQYLLNIYKMGRNAIEKGSRDSWTDTPSRVEMAKNGGWEAMRKPELRDARAYVITADQDYGNATRFVNSLLKAAVEVHKAKSAFTANGTSYPAGSYVVRCDQAFRPHVLDMFEPQDHPNDLAYPGGPPVAPYDSAGYTLAYQMGIKFDRLLDGPPAGNLGLIEEPLKAVGSTSVKGDGRFLLKDYPINGYTLASRALQSGAKVHMLPMGLMFNQISATKLEALGETLGLRLESIGASSGGQIDVRQPRVALVDRYGGSMPSGWIRWILEQFDLPFTVVYPKDIDGGLVGKFDAIIFPSDISVSSRSPREIDESSIPDEYRGRLGSLTSEKSLPRLKEFAESGGTIIAIGAATRLGSQLGLGVTNHLVANAKPLPRDQFYIPGSVLRMRIDRAFPVAWGMPEYADVMFDEDPVYKIGSGIENVGWFESAKSLRSGWALGQPFLENGTGIAHAPLGKGHVYLFAPEITFRAQPSGTFKLLFNSLFLSTAKE